MPGLPSLLHRAYWRLAPSESPPVNALRRSFYLAARVSYRSRTPVLTTRTEFPVLMNQRNLLGTGFEIGVREGGFSELILERWRGRRLISVDPWREAPAEEYVDVANRAQAVQDALYEETRQRLARFSDRSEIWRTTSVEAAQRVQPGSADFVYLDARHDYDSVREDLEAWYPKVRPGGILAGHDYLDGVFPEGVFGVKTAVDEFFGARAVKVSRTLLDLPWRSWLVIVPETAATRS